MLKLEYLNIVPISGKCLVGIKNDGFPMGENNCFAFLHLLGVLLLQENVFSSFGGG